MICISGLIWASINISADGKKAATMTLGAGGSFYSWEQVSPGAAFPVGYNFPVFVVKNRMLAMHGQGIWESLDGRKWELAALPPIRSNVYVTQYVHFRGSIFALGQNEGNFQSISFGSRVRRTTDFKTWEILKDSSNLPGRIFYGLVVFKDRIWLLGGYDGRKYYNDVWNSEDGVNWTRVAESSAWSKRTLATTVVYRGRLWIIGGGVIDGQPKINKNEENEIWTSADGLNWELVTGDMPSHSGGSPVVFDDKLWLVGANRDGTFAKSSLVTSDGKSWEEISAPWSPRGGVATWIWDGKLYMTGGKYSVTENGQIRFIYSNDVWAMDKAR